MDVWASGNQEEQERMKLEMMMCAVNKLHFEIYGEIASLAHELTIHVFNEDYEACKQTLVLLKAAING